MGRDGGQAGGGVGAFHVAPPRNTTWRFKDDFCAQATCRRCGASVFFIQHNGGSVVVDELGWPWPRHGCYSAASDPSWLSYMRAAPASTLVANSFVGIVAHARWLPSFNGQPSRIVLAVDGGANARKCVAVRGTNTAGYYLGCVALVNVEAATLVASNHRVEPILNVAASAEELGLPRNWEMWGRGH